MIDSRIILFKNKSAKISLS